MGTSVPKKRDLPQGVYKAPSGKFESRIRWGGKHCYIGTFDTPEKASAACMSARENLDNAKLLAGGADAFADATFEEAKKKALEPVGKIHSR